MTPPDAPDAPRPTGTRRHRRHVKRVRAHRRRRRVIGLAVTILVVAAGAAVATDAVRLDTNNQSSLSRSVNGDDGAFATPGSATTLVPTKPCRADLTSTDPLKVWVGGDSLAGSLGPAFGTIAGATGVVQPYFHSRVSSGLSNPGFVDWPALATKEMASVNPDVVVFIISTNDYPVPTNKTVDSTTGEPAWKATYAKQVEDMLAVLGGSGRTVYWLGAPVLMDSSKNDGVKQLDAVEQAVVQKHRNAEYVDTYSLFADRDGKYSANVTDDGKTIVARAGDGVHFTMDGANYLAHAVYKLLDTQCRLTAQSVPGQVKQTIQTPGSTQVAPSGNSGSSSGGNTGGGSLATTPPATASVTPPSTSPPAATTPPTTASPATTATPTTTTAH
jgi:hypothetical protein